jgi:hypothetical protein
MGVLKEFHLNDAHVFLYLELNQKGELKKSFI